MCITSLVFVCSITSLVYEAWLVTSLAATLACSPVQAKLDKATKTIYDTRVAKEGFKGKIKGTADRVRKEEKAKAKEQISNVTANAKEEAEKAVDTKMSSLKANKANAHTLKRAWKERAEKALAGSLTESASRLCPGCARPA